MSKSTTQQVVQLKTSLMGSAGALAGNPFGVDRQFIAEELGFVGGVCPNSMDAVSDRDYVLDTLYFVAVHLTHLSRWAEDLIIYSSGLFKFVQCSDAYATGELPGLGLCWCSTTNRLHATVTWQGYAIPALGAVQQ